MDIYKALQKYSNFSIEKLEYLNKEVEYYIADYYVNNNQFLKYVIFDLTQNDYSDLLEWKNDGEFSSFQTDLLEDIYFRYIGDERYNIYLIFIVPDKKMFFTKVDILNDFQYARKIILQESEVDNFFIKLFPLQRKSRENESFISESFQQKEIKKELEIYGEKCFELFKREVGVRFYIAQYIKKKKNTEIISQEMIQLLSVITKCSEKVSNVKDKKGKTEFGNYRKDTYNIEQIRYLNANQYRRFQKKCRIPFKKVNLLFGDNGVGKTSILDAIGLGITGDNSNMSKEELNNIDITIECISKEGKNLTLTYKENNYVLSEKWYGMRAENSEEFSKFFGQYNYFDTRWASAFAIEGEEQVNIKQIQKFLGIDDFEEYRKNIQKFLNILYRLSVEDQKYINKVKRNNRWNLTFVKHYYKKYYGDFENENKVVQDYCKKYLKRIKEDIEFISWETVIKEHINKIENVFKLLISTDEYTSLKIQGEEIVATRSNTGEIVSMSKMSTGQKVCLALAFMFALFLSSETAPNFILLDEPVANLDDIHMLNLLDLLRRLSLSGTQIFFTTANPDVAKLFRRKFSYLEEEFGFYRIVEAEDYLKIDYEQYSQSKEEPIKIINVY